MVERIPPLASIGGRAPHLWIGGLRFLGDPARTAVQAFPSPLVDAAESEQGWYFLLRDGTLWRASAFLDEATRIHRFTRGSRLGEGSAPLLVVDGSGIVNQVDGVQVRPLAGLEQHAVVKALSNGHVFVKDARGTWLRRDGSEWTIVGEETLRTAEHHTEEERAQVHQALMFRMAQLGYHDGLHYDGVGNLYDARYVLGADGVRKPVSIPPMDFYWATPDGLVASVNSGGRRMFHFVAAEGTYRPVDLSILGDDHPLDSIAWVDGSSLLFTRDGSLCRFFFASGRVEDMAIDVSVYGDTLAYSSPRLYLARTGNGDTMRSVGVIDLDERRGSYIALPRPGVATQLTALPDGFLLSVREGEDEERSDRVYHWHAPTARSPAELEEKLLPNEGYVLAPSDGAFWLLIDRTQVRTSLDEGEHWSASIPYRSQGSPRCDAHGCRVGDLVISVEGTFPSPLPFYTTAPITEETGPSPPRMGCGRRSQNAQNADPDFALATLTESAVHLQGQVEGQTLSFRSPLDPSMAARPGEAVAIRVNAMTAQTAYVVVRRSNGWSQSFILRDGRAPTRVPDSNYWLGSNRTTISALQHDGVRVFRADGEQHYTANGIWLEGGSSHPMREFADHRWATLEGPARVARIDRNQAARFCEDADAPGPRLITTYRFGRHTGVRIQANDPPCIDEVYDGSLVGRAFAGELSRGDLVCRFATNPP